MAYYISNLSDKIEKHYVGLSGLEKRTLLKLEDCFLTKLKTFSLKWTRYDELQAWLDNVEETNDLQQELVSSDYYEMLDTLIAVWDEQLVIATKKRRR